MQLSVSVRVIFLFFILILFPVKGFSSPILSIGSFNDKNGTNIPAFSEYLRAHLFDYGIASSNSTSDKNVTRYSLSGLVEKNSGETSYSALLTDNFHLEPEIFIKGKQVGGKSSAPAAANLAESVAKLISNQSISSVEVSGDSRLTPNAVMALAQIFPGETATPQKIIAARIILENCGLFDTSRIFLIPGTKGRKVKISIQENKNIITAEMPGPGLKLLKNILSPADTDLPEFPVSPGSIRSTGIPSEDFSDLEAYRAGQIIQDLSLMNGQYTPEDLENLIETAGAIRDMIYSYDNSCRDLCIILMKLCSILDARTVREMTENLQRAMEVNPETPSFDQMLARIEFLSDAHAAAQEAQTILASRIFENRQHSPVTPWIMHCLGTQALKAEDTTKAAPLLAAAVSLSSLPVSPEMLITAAKAQYSNLDIKSGDAAFAMLKPLLANPDLPQALRRQIKNISRWSQLCEKAISVKDNAGFEMLLKKGNALILLDRPDLAEPLFHDLHSRHPDDARPFTGFARLAYQRTGKLLSSRPYIERAAKLSGKDRFFYELALAYNMERISKEALPTIRKEGRESEEASATRFLLPKSIEYVDGYEPFNPARALLIKSGINVLDRWLAYPAMTDGQAVEYMFHNTVDLREKMPQEKEIITASYFFSINSPDRSEVRRILALPLPGSIRQHPRFMQLNLLIREMANNPDDEMCFSLEQAASAAFSDEKNRGRAVSLQADAHAISGFYRNSTADLEKAISLYDLAVDLNDGENMARLINNQACLNLILGRKGDADDLYDEALDNNPAVPEIVELGKILSSTPESDRKAALEEFVLKTTKSRISDTALTLLNQKYYTSEKKLCPLAAGSNFTSQVNEPEGMPHIFLQENSFMGTDYDNYNGLQIIFRYDSNPWLIPITLFSIRDQAGTSNQSDDSTE